MYPISNDLLVSAMQQRGIKNLVEATIRQICSMSAQIEKLTGLPMVHLELGNPGLPASRIGIEAEIEALRNGIANKYPSIEGLPELKEAGKRFVKAFLDVDVPSKGIVPTVGSMQGTFTLMLLLKKRDPKKDTILFINPGFPAQHTQARILDFPQVSFDVYDYRGDKFEEKLESILSKGNISTILYSNPNNPAWTNLTERELEILGRMATKYDAIVMEDLAYLGMDFRNDYSVPFCEPYIPSVAKFTDNFILLISGSKIFSYAGQRIAMICMSDHVAERNFPAIKEFFSVSTFLDAYIYGILYGASSGTTHSAQKAFTAMLDAAAEGRLDFIGECREYGRRGERAKQIFTDNGFELVYAVDGEKPIGDGFFFTVGYPGMTSGQLQSELLRHGVATVSLPGTGSKQEGVRVCVSMLDSDEKFDMLNERLKNFRNEHKS